MEKLTKREKIEWLIVIPFILILLYMAIQGAKLNIEEANKEREQAERYCEQYKYNNDLYWGCTREYHKNIIK